MIILLAENETGSGMRGKADGLRPRNSRLTGWEPPNICGQGNNVIRTAFQVKTSGSDSKGRHDRERLQAGN